MARDARFGKLIGCLEMQLGYQARLLNPLNRVFTAVQQYREILRLWNKA